MPAWLGAVNTMLLVFNLVPAFPLDGGRILRGVLWARRGDRAAATRIAVRGGRIFAVVLMAAGVVEMFTLDDVSGLWLVFIGWFLSSAAGAEGQGEAAREALTGVTVGEVMSRHPVSVPSWITVQLFVEQYATRFGVTAFPTRDIGGRIDGLVSLESVRRLPRQLRSTTRLSEIATPLARVPTATPGEPVGDLVLRLGAGGDGSALVFDGVDLVGVISPGDVVRRLQVDALDHEPPRAAA